MKPTDCAVCGAPAKVHHADSAHGALYGVRCEGGHAMGAVFETKRKAIMAWDECQRFVEANTEEVD